MSIDDLSMSQHHHTTSALTEKLVQMAADWKISEQVFMYAVRKGEINAMKTMLSTVEKDVVAKALVEVMEAGANDTIARQAAA